MSKEKKLQIYPGELEAKAVRRDSRHTAEDGNHSEIPNSSPGLPTNHILPHLRGRA